MMLSSPDHPDQSRPAELTPGASSGSKHVSFSCLAVPGAHGFRGALRFGGAPRATMALNPDSFQPLNRNEVERQVNSINNQASW